MAELVNRRGRRKQSEELIAARRLQVCDAAIRLFSSKGFHGTTIEAVAQAADVSTGLIYKYFKDKEDLLYFAFNELLEDYSTEIPKAAALAADPLDKFRASVHAYARVIDKRKRTVLLANRASHSLGRERLNLIMRKEVMINSLIAKVVDECISAGTFRDIDAQMFTYQIVVFVNSWPLEAWRLPQPLSVEQFVDRGLALMLPAVEVLPVAQAASTRSMKETPSPSSRVRRNAVPKHA
jgi:AcrR family transcriptional regulator